MRIPLLLFFHLLAFCVWGQSALTEIDAILQKAYKDNALNGNVLIAKGGRVLYAKSFGLSNSETKASLTIQNQFQIASVSKQFTAFGIMLLKQQGKLRYDDKVVQYIPELPYPDITLRQLMQHTAGLPDFWNDIRPNLDTARSNGNMDVIRYLGKNKLPLRFEPGEKWEYSDIGYDFLATIIERVSKKSYQKFMKKYVFRPAGMKHTAACLVTDQRRIKAKKLATGYLQDSLFRWSKAYERRNFVFYLGDFYGDGSIISTTFDLKKWDDALRGFMKQDSLHFGEAYQPAVRKDGSMIETQKGVGYGLGWGVRQDPLMGKIYSHNGGHPGFLTHYFRYPDKDLVLIICRNVEPSVGFSPYLQAVRGMLPSL